MNPKLALVAVVVVVACGALWMLLSDSSGGRGDAPRVETASAPVAPAQAPARELTPAPVAGEERTLAPARVLEHETFPTDGARWLDVTVVLPAGAPAEDRPALLGFAPRSGDAFEEYGAESISGVVGLDDSFAAELEDEHDWSRRPLAARVRLPFPASAKAGLLLVQSRYLHLEPLAVDLEATSELTLEPELGGWVTGRCMLPEGRSVAPGDVAIVFHVRPDGPNGFATGVSREVHVAADLSFTLRALSSRNRYMVQARASGLVGYSMLSFTVEPGQHRELEIAFHAGATITGFVRAEGQPVAGAHVSTDIQSLQMWGDDVSTLSVEDGTFRLTGVPPGKLELNATKDGWVAAKGQSLSVVEGQQVDGIELELSAGLRIAGRVLWPDGTPAVGAAVQALRSHDGWMEPLAETRSESDGQFLLGGLPADPCELFASHGPRGSTPAELEGADWMAKQSAVLPGSTGLVLTLAPPLPLRGTVVDDAGAPLTNIQISAQPEGSPGNSPEAVNDFFESPDGSFTLGVARAGRWSVTAMTEDGARHTEPVSVAVPQGGEPLRLVIPRTSRVSGVVVDPRGKPVAEARLNVSDDPSEAAFGFYDDGETQSGDDGRFTLEDLAPGSSVFASHADWAASESVALDLAPGETRTDLVLTLRIGARVTGELFDAEGKPEAGKNVNCSGGGAVGAMAFGFGAERSTLTDGAGRFAFEHMTPGKLTVTAMPSQEELMEQMQGGDEAAMLAVMSEMRSASVEVPDGGEGHVVLGAKPKKPVRVHGVVTEAGGPLADKGVLVFAEGGALLAGMKMGRTDASGRYEVLLDRPGDHVFSVTLGEGMDGAGMPFYVEVPEAEEFELDLALPLGRIAGTVLGPDGPAADVQLRLVSSAGLIGFDDLSESNQARSESDGAFEFHHLRAGEYALHVGSNVDFDSHEERFGQVVVDGLRLEADRAVEGLVVQLAAPGTLEGRVLDGAGKPVGGLSIFVRDASGRAISTSSCSSDSLGRFRYVGVAPGRVTASARGAELVGPESAEIEVRSGETTSVELVVAPGTFLRVSLLDGDTEVRARLRVVDEHGRRVDDLFRVQDMAALITEGFSSRERKVGPLAPGKYTLHATSLDGKDAKKSVTIEGGREERSVKLRLR